MTRMRRLLDGSLIIQLIILMTLALLPLGLIALYQTNAVVDEATRLSHAELLARTERAAARERELLQRAGGVAGGLAAVIGPVADDPTACSDIMRAFVEGQTGFTFAAFTDSDGMRACSSDGTVQDVSDTWAFLKAEESEQLSFAVDRGDSADADALRLLASNPVSGPDGVIGFITIAIAHNLTDPAFEFAGAGRGIQLVTVDNQGDILSSSMPLEAAALAMPVSVARRQLHQRVGETFREAARSGRERFFAVSEIIPGQVVVLGSWPVDDALAVSGQSPASVLTLLFPVLMWLAGIGVAVFGLQQLVIRHLNALRSSMRRYALGERDHARLELHHPPREFEEAQVSFNRMVAILSEAERRREMDLEEKTILLREVHHRVKNNLQLIASIMNMQGRNAQMPETRRVLSQLQRRVRGLATIHRSLNTNPDITTVDSAEMIQGLIDEIGTMNVGNGQSVAIETDLISVPMEQDQAVTLSMLVSEAITNAVKYVGVPEGGRPAIWVSLTHRGDGWLVLEIANTRGTPVLDEDEDTMGTGIGQRLMQAFATQLDGEAETVEQEDRFAYRLVFPAGPAAKQQLGDSGAAAAGGG